MRCARVQAARRPRALRRLARAAGLVVGLLGCPGTAPGEGDAGPVPVATPAPAARAPALPAASLWAGHQRLVGRRWVPVLGHLATRTDSYVLAEVEQRAGVLTLRQRTCRMDFAPVAGARFAFDRRALAHLPVAQLGFRLAAAGHWRASPWVVGWGPADDLDGDGQPGARIEVVAPLCSGSLHVASRAVSVAEGRLRPGGGLVGQVGVVVTQRILAASGACLRLVARDSREQLSGFFAYTPVAVSATCERLLARGWPIRAPESAVELLRRTEGPAQP